MRSGLEGKIRKWLEESSIPFAYEPCSFPYLTMHNYTPDLLVDGKYIEIKGRFTTQDRTKLLSVKKCNPDLNLHILFQRNQPIRKGSKIMYSDWAEKNGFVYSILKDEKNPTIPQEWLDASTRQRNKKRI